MTSHLRSKSCGGLPHPKSSFFRYSSDDVDDDVIDDICYYCQDYTNSNNNNNYTPITTPFISPRQQTPSSQPTHNFTIVSILLAALRKSLLTCTVNDSDDVSNSLDIGCPTDVRHVAHVTFDRFNGFLGLPISLQSHVPCRVPSASVCVFGVSVESMQCSYDSRGNSVPTILLTMQKRLYAEGGLEAEGIFRINGENGQEEYIRKQLNKGFVPHGVDIHCLAGLIKAWFRELPRGVLDSLTPEQVMHCNTEDECTRLVKSLPPTEAALLDWAINLMADVVKYDQVNKMNARNIAMVFAPNMTQMADPLTALIHAVQIMNLLKTLVLKTLREREESSPGFKPIHTCEEKPEYHNHSPLGTATLKRLGSENEEQFWSFPRKSGSIMEYDYMSGNNSPVSSRNSVDRSKEEPHREVVNRDRILEKLSLRKGVRRLCRHPVFQLSKPAKKTGTVVVDARDDDVAWS
ncbi:rho GTPase-activating protein 5-like [Bidens hawaiensis]|uniref:rho GTPase-activating protein 5-like n=1 Tax=Bidens hawaiensis TaxID=980011 RepID=UPI00404BA06B